MKKFVLLLAAIIVVTAVPSISEAACGRGLLGWRPLQSIAARRAEGRGIGQRNGPAKRLVRGER